MNASPDRPLVILPSQVESWLSGVSQVQIAPDDTVDVLYEDGSKISARIAALPYALQSNFFALVRRVQDLSPIRGRGTSSPRLA